MRLFVSALVDFRQPSMKRKPREVTTATSRLMLWVVQPVFTTMNHNTRHSAIVRAGAPVPRSCGYLPYEGTSLPMRDGGLHGRLALLQYLFQALLPWYPALRRRYHPSSVTFHGTAYC